MLHGAITKVNLIVCIISGLKPNSCYCCKILAESSQPLKIKYTNTDFQHLYLTCSQGVVQSHNLYTGLNNDLTPVYHDYLVCD